ncbi:hypothetical protein [Malacoplasma muris]|uniref:hypothetical protein n=1 Tax=Malacoplasma muris TaxID=2119 RepID=UPI00398F26F7
MKRILLYFTNKYFGEWEKIYYALSDKEVVPKKYYENTKLLPNYISVIDKNYPDELKTIYKPPFSLFWYGNFDLLSKKMIGVYGYSNDKNIIDNILKLKKAVYVVDYNNSKLINLLMKNNINFICIYKNGIDNKMKNSKIYSKIINSNNLIITEIPSNNSTNIFIDQMHNRIIFGLSKIMIFLDDNDKYSFESIIQICKLESISCYSYKKLSNDYLISINDINKIICQRLSN